MQQFINLIIFILGASIGSFLNVLIDRLPKDEGINGRSYCDFCRKKIGWYDLIPILSFFMIGGKTRCCRKKLSWQYPLVEFVTGVVFVVVIKNGPYVESLTRTVLIISILSSLIVIFVSDFKYHLISDYILLAFFIFSVFYHISNLFWVGINPTPTPIQLIQPIMSGLVVSFPIFLIYFISKERAMGLGDVFLAANMGFLLGWKAGFMALYIAFITGAIIGLIAIILKNKKLKSKIAFGPFLVIGTIIMLFFSDMVWQLISKVYRF